MEQKEYGAGPELNFSTPTNIVISILIFTVYPVGGLGLLFLTIWLIMIYESITWFIFLLLAAMLGTSAFLLVHGWAMISDGMAKYQFQTDGLQVKYPLEKEKLIPWDEFQQVCVCYSGYTTRGERSATPVICCVMQGEKKNGYGRWKTDAISHYRSTITFLYTPERYAGIQERCPYEVPDLRTTLTYRYDWY